MNKKNLLTLAAIAIAVGLTAWIIGRQFASAPERAHVTSTGPSAGPMLKAVSKTTITTTKAPSTPAHEKAFLEEQLKANPNHPPTLLRLAEMEHADGKLPQARQHLEQAIKSDPTLIDARLELSLVCYEMNDPAEAEKQNLAVLKQDSKQPDALYNLGAIYANHDRYAEARQFWNDAVKYGKDSPSGKNAAVALTKLPR